EAYFRYEKERRAPIFDPDTEDLNKLLNANNYQKGGWVLHMLRSQLGDEVFFRGIRAYYEAHKNSTATTEDLRAALERAGRTSLRDFFARWVYGSGHPIYAPTWTWRATGKRGGVLTINLRQTQTEAAFNNPLPVEILLPTGKTRTLIKPTSKATVKRVPLAERPTDVRFDPDETILKEVVAAATP
ncbi:MAG TPA: M1 family aminopeptidase, partial [Pyrinomonadaceae bacterium]